MSFLEDTAAAAAEDAAIVAGPVAAAVLAVAVVAVAVAAIQLGDAAWLSLSRRYSGWRPRSWILAWNCFAADVRSKFEVGIEDPRRTNWEAVKDLLDC